MVLAPETFRGHLNAAGLTRETRPDLFPEGAELKKRMPVRVHDIRGLFVTASLAQGRSDTWVRERTLHETPSMLDRYRRTVPHFKEYGPITPTVLAVPELTESAKALGYEVSIGGANRRHDEDDEAKYLFRRRDSNCERDVCLER